MKDTQLRRQQVMTLAMFVDITARVVSATNIHATVEEVENAAINAVVPKLEDEKNAK